ncbi:MAG: hypothetical protein PGN09_01300 [Sphingomonas fennica]
MRTGADRLSAIGTPPAAARGHPSDATGRAEQEAAVGQPADAERIDVLARHDRPPVAHQFGLAVADHGVDQRSVRCEAGGAQVGRAEAIRVGLHRLHDLRRGVAVHADHRQRAAVGDIGDAAAVAAPRRLRILPVAVRDHADRAGGDVHDVDGVAARPVGREGEAPAVGRPAHLAMVVGAAGQLGQAAAVGPDRPDVEIARSIGLEGDGAPVGRPVGLGDVLEIVGQAAGGAAGDGGDPQDAELVECQPLAVGRGGEGDVGRFRHGRRDVGGGGGVAAAAALADRHARRRPRRQHRAACPERRAPADPVRHPGLSVIVVHQKVKVILA